MSIPGLTVELLRAEFPNLRPDHDPDVERYFDLRSAGKPQEALALYRGRLVPRYPDDAFRARLLRAYRLKDPALAGMLAASYAEAGERALERAKRAIKYVALKAASYDPRDAYSTIKAAEAILAMLPREPYAAIAAVERLHRWAERLDFNAAALARAEDLVRAYLTESLEVVAEAREKKRAAAERENAERRSALVRRDREEMLRGLEKDKRRAAEATALRAEAARREARAKGRRAAPALLDLSSVRFSAADLARIQIPPTLRSVEDRTLAFCFKYWNLCGDAAFERVVFLYSRKEGTKHHEVFEAIRRGRLAGRRDDEILAAVSAVLITGYYYSIRGDAYLQRGWAVLKARLEGTAAKQKEPPRQALPAPAVPPAPSARTARAAKRLRSERRGGGRAGDDGRITAKPPVPAPAARKTAGSAPPPERKAAPPAPTAPRPQSLPPERAEPRSADSHFSRTPAPLPAQRPRLGSVSDKLRRLSGRSYDLYRDRFLEKVRGAIRAVLSDGSDGRRALFASVPKEAEDLVFDFLRDHYDDPYMDWEAGDAKAKLEALGYRLDGIDGVIEECYRRL